MAHPHKQLIVFKQKKLKVKRLKDYISNLLFSSGHSI